MRSYKYNFELSENSSVVFNLLRIIAIQFVVIGHGISFLNIIPWLQKPNFPDLQKIGVMVFFLISGFLITYTTLRKANNEKYTFKEYYIERFSRIYIVYLPILILIIFLDFILFVYLEVPNIHNSNNVITFIYNLFMLQDIHFIMGGYTSFGSARVLWTLAMFWWIFMLFGWLILGPRTVNKYFLFILILILILFITILIGMGIRSDIKLVLFVVWTGGSIIALLMNHSAFNAKESLSNQGNFKKLRFSEGNNQEKRSIFKWLTTKPKLSLAISLIFLLLACIRVYYIKNPYHIIFGLLLVAALLFYVIYSNHSNSKVSDKKKKIIRFIASYSFTLFLLHYTIFWIFSTFTDRYSSYLLFVIAYILSNVFSIIIAYFTEMRYKKLRVYMLKKFSKDYYKLLKS